MGRYQEILTPDMTVPHPIYHLHSSGTTTTVLDGKDAVVGFYRELTESGACVMGLTDDRIAVSDWGFAIESTFLHYYPGKVFAAGGLDIDDEGATYLATYPQAMGGPTRRTA